MQRHSECITSTINKLMKEVYEKLLQRLAEMTPEEKAEEWEALKAFNEIGPEAESYLETVRKMLVVGAPIVAKVDQASSVYMNSELCYAA